MMVETVSLVDGLIDDITNVLDDVANTTKSFFSGLWEGILDIKYTFVYYFEKAMDLIKSIALTIRTEITKKIFDTVHYINGKISWVTNSINNSINGVYVFINSQVIKLKNLIADGIIIVTGLISDFKIMVDNLFSGIYKTLSEFADILFDPTTYFNLFESVIDALW